LAFPSASGADEQSNADLEVDGENWKREWSEAAQAEWTEQHLPLLISKQAVTGIFWSHYTDAAKHDFPHAGLLRPDGTPKPALEKIIAQRQANWE